MAIAKPVTVTTPFRYSSSTGRGQFSKVPKPPSISILFTSIPTKISLKIRFEKKEKDLGRRRSKRKQNPRDQNAQIGGLGFAVLGALKTDRLPKNRIENTHMNKTQETEKNGAENVVNDAPIKQKNDAPIKQKNDREKTGTAHKATSDYNGSKDSESLRALTLERNDDLNSNSIVGTRKPSLSGEDILMAMQRASMEKAKEAGRNRRPKQKVGSRGLSDVRKDVGEIKPIVIKSEWADRIENLEKCLKELKEKADLT